MIRIYAKFFLYLYYKLKVMKKLIIAFSLIAGSVVGQYNQAFIDRFCGYPNHRFPKGHVMAHYSQGIVNFPIKNTKTYNGRKETDKFTRYDSLSRVTLERFIFDRLNYYRKRYGVHELKWDERIRPATYHHVQYQRVVGKSVHVESEDLPNFTEYRNPWGRVELLDQQVFAATQECLLQSLMVAIDHTYDVSINATYKEIVDKFFTVGKGLNSCAAHWELMMDSNWDAVYFYLDFGFRGKHDPDGHSPWFNFNKTLAKYID